MQFFSGSYPANDVQILLKPIEIASTPIAEKERLIQSKHKHYSEMITKESLPSKQYLELFKTIFAQNNARLATDLINLASKIAHQKPNEIVLISLARAGTPIGVLLNRILKQYFKRKCSHYSVSIIRDRGLDANALQYILQQHSDPNSFTFIDGWTGKGVIAEVLHQSMADFNAEFNTQINSDLYVLNDIAGVAAITASFDDYLIPSSLLNATVSGLISRSILNADYIGAEDFHGCIYYAEFLHADLSLWFIDATMKAVQQQISADLTSLIQHNSADLINKAKVNARSIEFIQALKHRFQIKDVNLIKPGIGEATRVLLRRVPDMLLLKALQTPETEHLVMLATEKNIPIIADPSMPYQAVAIIQELNHD